MAGINRINFTKSALAKLTPPLSGRSYYRDEQQPGLGLALTEKGTISFFVVAKTARGSKRRVILGRYPRLSITGARIKAKKTIGKAAEGVDVIEAKQEARRQELTLQEALDDYIQAKGLKASTVDDYRRSIRDTFGDLQDKELAQISRDMVLKRYQTGGKRSQARTDNAARVLRAVFNFAHIKNLRDDGTSPYYPNPVAVVRELKVQYPLQRRNTVIHTHQLADWWQAVEQLRHAVAQDFLKFLLLTGCRKNEAAQLKWKDIDIRGGMFRLNDPKNKQPVTLPLPGYVAARLRARDPGDPKAWVFPGPRSGKYYDNPYTAIVEVRKKSGVSFACHDLRRTFLTVGEGLDISAYTLKRLVNHKMSNDVTAGYIISSFYRLAAASKRIENEILTKVRGND